MKIVLLILFGFLFSASAINDDARKANEAFRNGDYETAAQLYQSAIEENPNDPRLHFNLGNALSKMGMMDEAMESFENFKLLSEDSTERSKADYNTGTMLSESEMYDEAATFFKNALKENPGDPDAKHNYELALRKQQEQEQEQEEQSDDQNEGEDEQEDEQQGEDNQDEGEQEEEQDQNQDQGDGEQEQDDQQSQPEPQDLSEEEAESILNALEQLERELLEGNKKEASEKKSSNDKDW